MSLVGFSIKNIRCCNYQNNEEQKIHFSYVSCHHFLWKTWLLYFWKTFKSPLGRLKMTTLGDTNLFVPLLSHIWHIRFFVYTLILPTIYRPKRFESHYSLSRTEFNAARATYEIHASAANSQTILSLFAWDLNTLCHRVTLNFTLASVNWSLHITLLFYSITQAGRLMKNRFSNSWTDINEASGINKENIARTTSAKVKKMIAQYFDWKC